MPNRGKCFFSGTRIRTARGAMTVESIRPGDELVVIRGGTETTEPVIRALSARIDLASHPRPEDVAPVRFRRNAIADGQPHADLLVSPEHSMIIGGLCVPAKYLVNGATIVMERHHGAFTYHHLELARHGILIAEGALSESYLETGDYDWLDADGKAVRPLFPAFTANATAERWQTDACAPLARVPEDVAPIWASLAERAVALGHTLPEVVLAADADIHLRADGREIRALGARDGRHTFIVPARAREVRLLSRSYIPAHAMMAHLRDTRRLGVRVAALTIQVDDTDTVIPADHPGLVDGWHDAERAGQETWRWTDGAATIPWVATARPAIVTVACKVAEGYPADMKPVRRAA